MVYAYSHAAGFGLGFLNFIGSVLFFIFLFFVIKSLIYYFAGHKGGHKVWSCSGKHKDKEDEAAMVARERFAKGEVTTEEFNVLKTGLGIGNSEDTSNPRWNFGGRDRALGIARLRFAKGEITVEEFEAVKKVI